MVTEFETRELRRRKILDNQKSRINKILGLKGDELAPAIDGMPLHMSAASEIFSSQNSSELNDEVLNSSSCIDDDSVWKENGFSGKHASAEVLNLSGPKLSEVYRNKIRWYQRPRLLLSACVGLLFRVALQFDFSACHFLDTQGVVLPWLCLELMFEFHRSLFYKKSPFPSHGHTVDFLLSFGFPETLVIVCGRMAEFITRIIDDTVLWLLCFLLTHLVLRFADFPIDFSY